MPSATATAAPAIVSRWFISPSTEFLRTCRFAVDRAKSPISLAAWFIVSFRVGCNLQLTSGREPATGARGKSMILCTFIEGSATLLQRSKPNGTTRAVASILAIVTALLSPAVRGGDDDLPLNAKLLAAARNADGPAIERALQQGAAINSRNRLGESVLLIVLKKDRVDLARALIDADADVNQAALNGVTPLMAAAYGGHLEIARVLIAKGADVAAID